MITKIGKKGGRNSATKATIVDLVYRSTSPSSGLVSPLSNITFGDPYFRLTTDAEWKMKIDYFKSQSATITQSTANSVEMLIGIGSSNSNVLNASDSNSNNSCNTASKPPTVSGIVSVSSDDSTDERINFRHEDGGGTGRTVCDRLTLVTFRVLLLGGRDSIVEIDSANNPNLSHRFMSG